ncbi:MIP/aquaporin family protein [Streptomyces violaceusniger]|uniref:MIP/aquaporin family protein n=1 Tax=Streptomyces violaceusniger TaxID=68280 RepID=UPI0009964408|nr:aquaporin [Streptomyces hygroscopicus]AQW54674.1 glycerol uptake facilitator protein [Streptomyces hygroscopicus]
MDQARAADGRPAPPAPAGPVTWTLVARNSALECLLAFALLFGVTTIVRWIAGPSPVSAAIPYPHLKLLVIGACVGPLLAGLILSPAGKASGGHINPAISLAMWRFGVFPGAAVVPYIVAQLAGSLLGVLAGRAVWGRAAGRPPVSDAALQPGLGWSAGALFVAETASMAVIVLLVGLFLSVPRLAPLVPWLVGLLIGMAVPLLGTTTGGSVNPARQFGPAIVSGQLDFLWVYLLAPMVGAVAVTSLRNRFLKRRAIRTYRLCGTDCADSPPARPVDRVEAFEGTGLLMLALHRPPGRLRPHIGPVVHVAVRRLSRRWTPRPPCPPRPPQ